MVIEIKAVPHGEYLTVIIDDVKSKIDSTLKLVSDIENELSETTKFFTIYLKVPFDYSFHERILSMGYQTSFSLIGMYIDLRKNVNRIKKILEDTV